MPSDKRLYTELLLLYKDFPCLWDTRVSEYADKEARKQGYEVLLEKYKQIDSDATVADVKKKIEHMRTAYKREHKKVLISRLAGEDEHRPTLWYYHLMTFLNEVMDFKRLTPMIREIKDSGSTKKRSRLEDLLTNKRRKSSSPTAIYLKDEDSSVEEDDPISNNDDYEISDKQDTNQDSLLNISVDHTVDECKSFGNTVGLQLIDLQPIQRIIAEKLISDIIFDARFQKLTDNSSVVHK